MLKPRFLRRFCPVPPFLPPETGACFQAAKSGGTLRSSNIQAAQRGHGVGPPGGCEKRLFKPLKTPQNMGDINS